MKLYEIVSNFAENEQDKTDQECYDDTKELIILELESKSSNMIMLIQDKLGDIEKIAAEIKRLEDLKKYKQKQVDELKKYISWAMQEIDQKKIETPLGNFSIRKSESIQIENEKEIPSKFITIKQTEGINKTEIKEAIKAGEEVAGVSIKVNQNLQIK